MAQWPKNIVKPFCSNHQRPKKNLKLRPSLSSFLSFLQRPSLSVLLGATMACSSTNSLLQLSLHTMRSREAMACSSSTAMVCFSLSFAAPPLQTLSLLRLSLNGHGVLLLHGARPTPWRPPPCQVVAGMTTTMAPRHGDDDSSKAHAVAVLGTARSFGDGVLWRPPPATASFVRLPSGNGLFG
jgi:hypothetical protein